MFNMSKVLLLQIERSLNDQKLMTLYFFVKLNLKLDELDSTSTHSSVLTADQKLNLKDLFKTRPSLSLHERKAIASQMKVEPKVVNAFYHSFCGHEKRKCKQNTG